MAQRITPADSVVYGESLNFTESDIEALVLMGPPVESDH